MRTKPKPADMTERPETAGPARAAGAADAALDKRLSVRRVTLWGMLVNVALSGLKFVFGVLGHSQALVADAVHSLSDLATDVAVLVGVRYWSAPPDSDHPYGHGRIETLVSFFIGVALAAVGVGLAGKAVLSLHERHTSLPGWTAFAAACASILAKEALYQWTIRVGRRLRSTAVVANAWHHRSDALSSLPVALAVLATRIHPGWVYLDHIATVIVSVMILHASAKIARTALRQLIDTGADRKACQAIERLVLATPGVRATHALRTRQVGEALQVDLHIQVDPELTVRAGHDIARAVKRTLLASDGQILDVIVHIEPYDQPEGT
ncbi:MAG: cation transporter [Sedimentisphaerales bacterium]|nr:cation transporter [Sedimentisphaerales bacterium]